MADDDDGEMTELNEDGGPAPVGRPSFRSPKKLRRVKASQVEALLGTNLKVAEIARRLDMSPQTVSRAAGLLDGRRARRIRENSDAARGRLHRILDLVIDESLERQAVRDKNGKLIYDVIPGDSGQPATTVKATRPPGPSALKTVIQAVGEHAKLGGLHAPTQSMNVSLSGQMVNPHAQQALINDPEYCRLIMAAEERERAILAQGPGYVPGAVRGIGVEGEMVLPASSWAVEREDDAGGTGDDSPPGDIHATSTRQESASLDVLPGMVSRHLPGPGGDLGEL
jgi:hypothetical protein